MWNRKWGSTVHITVDFFQRRNRFKSRPQISFQICLFQVAGQCHYFLEEGPASHYPLFKLPFSKVTTGQMRWALGPLWLPSKGSPGRASNSSSRTLGSTFFSFLSNVCVLDFFFLSVGIARCKTWGRQRRPLTCWGSTISQGKNLTP